MDKNIFLEELAQAQVDEVTLQRALTTRFPTPIASDADKYSKEEKIALIAEKFRDIMQILGLDTNDDSLQKTPYRVAKMYVEEVFSGLDPETFPRISFIEDRFQHSQRANMIFIKTDFYSFCEHHFVPMEGTASIAYIPNGKLIGFSKIPRIVRFFSKRPQVQERLTAQIADALSLLTGSEHVAVYMSARHHCMIARGVECENSHATTHVLRGDFENNPATRQEFLAAIKGQ
jgi:GTP cyclohydrolase IA